jgi:cephalosporin-C deacetylase-like acetyl esterase
LHEQLLTEVSRQYAARRAAVAEAVKSPQAIAARQKRLRADYRRMLGELPERTPLNARTLGTIACDGYTIEKVIYESRPRHHVTANLYLPTGLDGRVPGVLVPCGHSDNGKASDTYQSAAALLARSGCAALIYDPIGQGERLQVLDLDRHGTTEHTLVGPGALAVGWNTANYRVWDGLRSLDYLASRPEIDQERLGCTGNSGGGTMTTWLMALDERIAAAAPSCFITTVERLFHTIGPQDCEQHFPAQGALGIEHADFIWMRACKPTLILAAERDFFDIGGTRAAFDDAQAVFRALSHPERIGLFTYDDEHGFSQPRREAAAAWMRRWLAGDERLVKEPPLKLERAQDLQVTVSGQVLREFADEVSVVDLAKERAVALALARMAPWGAMSTTERRAIVKRILGLPEELPRSAVARSRGTLVRDGYSVEKLTIERSPSVPLPALLFIPNGAARAESRLPAVLYADGRGKHVGASPGGQIEALVRQGNLVLAVDLAGCGETADKSGQKYRNDEFRTAMLAMHVGKSMVARRTEDVLAALAVLLAHPRADAKAIRLVGIERAGPPALHAAVLDPRISMLTLRGSIRSWADDVVARPLDANLLGQVVPGALLHYDLPDLVAMLGQRCATEPAQ